MPFIETVRARSAYAYILAGVAWLAVATVAGSLLILWPVVACLVSGALLTFRPNEKFTWSWVLATAVLGLLLAAYQVYSWTQFVSGYFTIVAGEAIAVFLALGVFHGLLLYLESSMKSAKPEQQQKTS